jgi:hypothetical protein
MLKISFIRLGHEECETCEVARTYQRLIEESCEICSFWSKHVIVRSSGKLYKVFSENAQSLSTDEVVVFSADLEMI